MAEPQTPLHGEIKKLREKIEATKMAVIGDPEFLLRLRLTDKDAKEILGDAVLKMLQDAGVPVQRVEAVQRRLDEKDPKNMLKVSYEIMLEF